MLLRTGKARCRAGAALLLVESLKPNLGHLNLLRALRQQVTSAVQLIVQASRLTGGKRKVTRVSEITGMEGDQIQMHDLFLFEQHGAAITKPPIKTIVLEGVFKASVDERIVCQRFLRFRFNLLNLPPGFAGCFRSFHLDEPINVCHRLPGVERLTQADETVPNLASSIWFAVMDHQFQ